MRKAVLPFLTIPEDLIAASPWEIGLSTGSWFSDPDYIEEWDNNTDIRARRTIELDFLACIEALRCPAEEVKLEVVVSIGAGAGPIPSEKWITYRAEIDPDSSAVTIDLGESGGRFADVLHIETSVILADQVTNPSSPISPIHEGSILWQEKKRIRLEGDVSRFPVSETNLKIMLGPEWRDALWYLQVDWEDPDSSFDSSVRLHINSLKEEFAKRVRKGDPETMHAVMADVITQIVRGYIKLGEDWELSSSEGASSFSLCQVARHWIETAFESPETARQTYSHAPGRFHAHLNALAAQHGGGEA